MSRINRIQRLGRLWYDHCSLEYRREIIIPGDTVTCLSLLWLEDVNTNKQEIIKKECDRLAG